MLNIATPTSQANWGLARLLRRFWRLPLCGFLLPSRVFTRLLHQHQSRERHSCAMRLIAGANGANLDRKVAINAGRELAVRRCARLIQTPASLLRTLRCDCALRPQALLGLTGRQGRGRITIGAKRRVPPVATSSCFAFSGARFGGRPLFIEEPSSSRHSL